MTRLSYFLRRALESMRRRPHVTLVAVVTIWVAVFVTGLCAAALAAGERLLSGFAGDAQVAVYLAAGSDPSAALDAAQRLAPGRRVVVVRPDEALSRLRTSLGDDASLLEGVAADVLPASLEVSAAGLALPEVRALAERLKQVPGAKDVDDGNAWVDGAERLLAALRLAGLAVFAGLAIGTAILVSNTLRLGVFARRDEIEIMKLVGATSSFVQAPFLIEGLLQGLAGAGLASVGLLAAHAAVAPRLGGLLRDAALLSREAILPGRLLLSLVLAGAGLGVVASALAVSRHLRKS
jgi:cell division transport system permease protein